MNRPLYQRARKDFIRLVDDDKIPETHKRLNLHYLRTLPYEAISTAPPIIVEAPEPKPEPVPAPPVILLQKGAKVMREGSWINTFVLGNQLTPKWVKTRDQTEYLSKPLYRTDAQQLFNDYTSTDEVLIKKFRDKYYVDKNFNW